MGYKVINKNVKISESKNIALDNIFYFQTKEPKEMIIEECSSEESKKFVFDQYHEKYNPTDLKLPNVVIEHPIEVLEGVPYWVTTRELVKE